MFFIRNIFKYIVYCKYRYKRYFDKYILYNTIKSLYSEFSRYFKDYTIQDFKNIINFEYNGISGKRVLQILWKTFWSKGIYIEKDIPMFNTFYTIINLFSEWTETQIQYVLKNKTLYFVSKII